MSKAKIVRARNFVITPRDIARLRHCEASHIYTAQRPKPSFAMWNGIFLHRALYVSARDRNWKSGETYLLSKKKTQMLTHFQRMHTTPAFKSQLPPIESPDVILHPEFEMLIDTKSMKAFTADYREADPDEHIYMRADLVWGTPTSNVNPASQDQYYWNVVDYKGGQREYDPSGDQNLYEAVAVWLMKERPVIVNSHIINISAGEPKRKGVTLMGHTLSEHLNDLRHVHLNVLETRADYKQGIKPNYTPGKWCDSCPVAPHCDVRKEWSDAQETIDFVKAGKQQCPSRMKYKGYPCEKAVGHDGVHENFKKGYQWG